MRYTVFVDGQEGTTGLQINEYLAERADVEVLKIAADKRKDLAERKRLINASDVTFLCLPDAAAKESVALVDNPRTCVSDASTAHRVHPDWVFGLPELCPEQRAKIRASKRIANPGCHASAFILAVRPLIDAGLIAADTQLAANSITGYSGGGKKMIADYEAAAASATQLKAPRPYALGLEHKHLPEIVTICHLTQEPVFTPIVDDYYSGMEVMIPFFSHLLAKKVTAHDVWQVLASHYDGCPFVHVLPFGEDKGGFIAANDMSGYDDMEILVTGNDQRIMVTSLFDNLGKGASGAAIQNMNLMMGIDATTGLQLKH